MAHTTSRRPLLLITSLALLVTSCNAVVGGGAVVLLGGAGFLAGQCYDRVRVRVYDRATGTTGCDAEVFVTDDGGSERTLRPCYNAALTEGKYTLTARRTGYVTVSTEIVIPEHEGKCPSYTHTVEFTMRREGEPAETDTLKPARGAQPAAAPNPAGDLDTPPSRVVPPPIPGVPTRSFEPVAPAAPAPSPPAPAPTPPAPAPTPPAPAPTAPAPPPPTPTAPGTPP